ncbi:MAG: hypothetical protein M1544_00030 [Candidatus Marsarchaeota archaeon]|nr:hypothetical protein [Candidatus Marsarchaeota archaeon]
MENAAAFAVSLVTVIAIIVTIAIFIFYGATTYFYAGALISIILGFLDAFMVSRAGEAQQSLRQQARRKPNGKGRASAAKRRK